MTGKCCGEAGIRVGIYFRPTLLRAKHGVSESLRRLVSQLTRAERLESDLPFIERALRCLARTVELFLELVE